MVYHRVNFEKIVQFPFFGFTIRIWYNIKSKERNLDKEDCYSIENLRKKSLSTLYRLKRAKKKDEGTFAWYLWPNSIKKVLNEAIQEKLDEMKKLPSQGNPNKLSVPA